MADRTYWRQTRPKLEAARDEETDPRENPRAFAVKVKEQFLDRGRSRYDRRTSDEAVQKGG